MNNSKDLLPRVHKFGGTSVGGAEELKAVANIIRNQTGPTVVGLGYGWCQRLIKQVADKFS